MTRLPADSRTTRSTSSPYASSLRAPMPLMPCRSCSDCGARCGDGRQRGVVKDHVGRQVVRARHLGAPGLQRGESQLRRIVQRPRRPRAAGAALPRAAARAAFAGWRGARLAQLHLQLALAARAREPSVSCSVLNACASTATRADRDQLAQHAAQLLLAEVRADAEGAERARGRYCATFSVALPRRMSMMWPAPKLMPLRCCTR